MISPAIATVEIRRLSGTTNYHLLKPEALQELVDALTQHAESKERAHAVIDLWLAENRRSPTVADVRDLLRTGLEDKSARQPRGGCAQCQGIGFVILYQLCTGFKGDLLRQTLAGGWKEAQAILDGWRAGAETWRRDHPGVPFKPKQDQSIGEVGRRCACNPAPAAKKGELYT